MADRKLQLDDINNATSPEKVTELFRKLGYETLGQSLDVDDLQLSPRSAEAIYDAHLIADQKSKNRAFPDLQVLLLTLKPEEWESPSVASGRMKAIATSLAKKPDNYLLIGTNQNHDRLLLVNPRKSSDAQGNVRVSIRKLLIDRAIPTAYDRDRLEAIAVRNLNPQELYKAHCEAFDVEKLTKVFYNGYRELFGRVKKVILAHNPDPYFEDSARLHQFSQRLLGRIMFIYFLQKKEFLAGDRRFLTRQYEILKPKPEGTNYYSDILEPLFFETLNQPRPNFESRFGKIPYLNGGLFDRDYGEGIKDTAGKETSRTITLPNSLFDRSDSSSILGFFNGYNFTISENVQGDEDVAVDPEMLGKVFENMLEAEERGKSGTFYTPRGIVNFMCVEVLSRYLADETGMTPDAIRELIELDPDLPDKDFNQKLTPAQAKALKKAIADVKILDPAVGSGAFPLGMMQVILAVRQAIERRESGRTINRGSLTISDWKREIIANNLYGVDIKPEAIEVAKLRMWLSLVVDIPFIENVEALPNLDYKLMCGDSLISSIHGEQLIPDPTKTEQLGLNISLPIQEAIQPLLDLQHCYYSAQTDERKALRQQILEVEANIFRKAVEIRKEALLQEKSYTGNSGDKNYKGLAAKSQLAQSKKLQEIERSLAELDKFAQEVERGDRAIGFFQYHLHFRDVFVDKGGFDIVIGNPPYVGQKGNKQIFEEVRKSVLKDFFVRNMDYYYFFFHLALNICRDQGFNAFITTNYYLTANGALLLRKDLKKRANILKILNFNELSIFESAKGQHNIITVFRKSQNRDNETHIIQTKRTGSLDNQIFEQIISGKDCHSVYTLKEAKYLYVTENEYLSLIDNNDNGEKANASSILEKITNQPDIKALGNLCNINQGILSGLDKISDSHIQKGLIQEQYRNHGVFVISQEELNNLELLKSEFTIIKPCFKNSDVNRYACREASTKYIIYVTRDINIDDYPNIKRHLNKFLDFRLKR